LGANKMFFTEKDHAIAKKLASLPRRRTVTHKRR
jgi:hypothetical protein